MILPKVDDAADVLFFDRLLTQIEMNTGLEIGRIRLEALIESAKGALHAEAIATSTLRLSGLIFGLVDFAGDIGAQGGRRRAVLLLQLRQSEGHYCGARGRADGGGWRHARRT